jgi:hypothetical protein
MIHGADKPERSRARRKAGAEPFSSARVTLENSGKIAFESRRSFSERLGFMRICPERYVFPRGYFRIRSDTTEALRGGKRKE